MVAVTDGSIHVVENGPPSADPILFLHGWPEDWSAWAAVMHLAGDSRRCLAIDLPGIGRSTLAGPRGEKFFLASLVHEVVEALQLDNLTLVGHDAGGMTAFAYLKQFGDLRSAVIMDTVIPGIPPWKAVLANPYLWHFAFHSIPRLPETLVHANIRAYFDYFYDAISAKKGAVPDDARARYAESYAHPGALTQGFEFYRAFGTDARDNTASAEAIATPVLYLRGDAEGGDIDEYAAGLRGAGLRNVTTGIVAGTGHFAPEEAPAGVWSAIETHLAGM